MDDKKKQLIELVRATNRVSIDIVAKRLDIDTKQAYEWAEELSKAGIIKLEPHFLRTPDLVATEKLKKAKKEKPKEEKPKEETKPKVPEKPKEKKTAIEIESYILTVDDMQLPVKILDTGDYTYHYNISIPHIDFVTRALLDETKRVLVGEVQIEARTTLDAEKIKVLKTKFLTRAKEKLKMVLKKSPEDYIATLSNVIVNEMIGLGDIEYLLHDKALEEVVVNNSKDVVWVYHKKYGWIKTNIMIPTEDMILNYSSRIAREVGREITHLEPLLDAHLVTGDRVNSTLYPISTNGNTITIRRFSRTPYTIVHLISPEFNTISIDAAAFVWLAIEYELSVLITGGTASGKTTILNAIMPFMPANHRIISMEDTRELNLPEYLHWIPLTIRPPNPQGEGEVSMLDLVQNALRMRPDRVIVGEVRKKRETEVMFEAMHTGHSVYGTFHANHAHELIERITTPPMSIPGSVLGSLHLVITQYRNRRTGARRTFEISELTKGAEQPELNTLYKWDSRKDEIEPMYPSIRVKEELELFTGMDEKEMQDDMGGKKKVLKWLLEKDIKGVNDVGRIVTEYYLDRDSVLELIKKDKFKLDR